MADQAFVFMGGTFDPVHVGHLRTALELKHLLDVNEVRLIPSKVPVHREEPNCSSEQRLAMLKLAVADEPALVADAREILSTQPSYTLLTLQGIRNEIGDEQPICMVMGMDAYLSLPSWHKWERFLDLCHLVVVTRPGYAMPESSPMYTYTLQNRVSCSSELFQTAAGKVLLQELTPLAISATQIRQEIARGFSPRYLLPDGVWQYIQENNLYGLTN